MHSDLVPGNQIRQCGLEAQVISTVRQWDAIREEWEALFEASPAAAAPLRFEWLRHWWDVYGPVYGRALHILIVRRESRLVGALPLYEAARRGAAFPVRRLMMLSTGENECEETCANYLNLLCLPEEEQACLAAIRHSLLEPGAAWDALVLNYVPARSPLVRWRSSFPPRFAPRVEPCGACAVSDLSCGLDRYLEKLSPAARKEARRSLTAAQRAGAVLEVASDAAEADEYFAQLVELHQRRWRQAGRPGCFAYPRFTCFHQELARRWAPRGQAMLARLSLRGEPLSVVCGPVVGRKFDCYLQGTAVQRSGGIRSPGTALLLLLRQHLAESGMLFYDDLMGGAGSSKHRFATDSVPLVHIRIVRTGMRTALHGASDFLRRAGRKGLRMLRGRAAQEHLAT